jgi:mannose-1-phosphate guanylyltransferase
MVFAAGRGERMRPLSDVMPKPALPLPGGPVISWPLRLATASGAERVVVNTWHLAELMERTVAEVDLGQTEVVVSREEELMGTGGGLALARHRGLLAGHGPLLVVNGDGVLNLDLQPLFERHRSSSDLVTLALLPHLDPASWSRVVLDSGGRVSSFEPPGRPAADEVPLLYPGVMLVARDALADLPAGAGGVMERLWRPAMAVGGLGGVVVSGHWREVGHPRGDLEVVMARLGDGAAVDPEATVDGDAHLGRALVGAGVTIEAGAVVAESVVARGAVVGRGARVIRSVLMGAVAAAPGEKVIDEFRATS